jgi:hypothetical protein
MLKAERLEIEAINRRHGPNRVVFYTQKRFCRQHVIGDPLSLCAGLIQVWWDEARKGNDGIQRLVNAEPCMVRDVLLSQAGSVYLRALPQVDTDFSESERVLLEFKYGQAKLSVIESLQQVFGVDGVMDLDLVLQHRAPIVEQFAFVRFGPEVIAAMTENARPGLRLLLMRYDQNGETGHRTALVIDPSGSCRFYDPSRGEICFSNAAQFGAWFAEYWPMVGWNS